jgi:hypothetical protein
VPPPADAPAAPAITIAEARPAPPVLDGVIIAFQSIGTHFMSERG